MNDTVVRILILGALTAYLVVFVGIQVVSYVEAYLVQRQVMEEAVYTWENVCTNHSIHIPSLGQASVICKSAREAMAHNPHMGALRHVFDTLSFCLATPCTDIWLNLISTWHSVVAVVGMSGLSMLGLKFVKVSLKNWRERRWRQKTLRDACQQGELGSIAELGAIDDEQIITGNCTTGYQSIHDFKKRNHPKLA